MDHILHKNFTKTDPLTISTAKAKELITDAANAQQQVVDRARRVDLHTTVDFPDMEICATSLYQAIPIQKNLAK